MDVTNRDANPDELAVPGDLWRFPSEALDDPASDLLDRAGIDLVHHEASSYLRHLSPCDDDAKRQTGNLAAAARPVASPSHRLADSICRKVN
jgi:hypothetical protein